MIHVSNILIYGLRKTRIFYLISCVFLRKYLSVVLTIFLLYAIDFDVF